LNRIDLSTKRMNKTVRRVLFYVVLLVVLVFLANNKFHFLGGSEVVTVGSGNRTPSALPVEAVLIKPKGLDDKLIVTGTLTANESVEIASEVAGIIEKISFREGQRVKKGDLLITLNMRDLEAQLDKIKFTLKLNETLEKRQRQLLEKDAISQEEYDISLTQLNTSQADLRLLEAQIAKGYIRAPFDGIIGLRYVSDGAFINQSTQIASLINVNPIKIEFSIPGKYSSRIGAGDKIVFSTDASDEVYEGEVYAVEPRIEQATRTLRIRARSDNSRGELFPGLFAKVEVVLSHKDSALMVPSIAVINDLNGHKVYLEKNGEVVEQPVEVGIRTDSEVEILNGIELNDTVITTGLLQITPGALVEITKVN